jgi:hypothetical protein
LFSFDADRAAVLAALRRARAMAMNSVCAGSGCFEAKSHGIHFDPTKKEAVIFQGDDFAGRDYDFDEVIEFENRAVFIEAPAMFDVVFLPPFGNSAASAIILKDDIGRRAEILVSGIGRIDWR